MNVLQEVMSLAGSSDPILGAWQRKRENFQMNIVD
jgi:hypothetical protein